MKDPIYRLIELNGSSTTSLEDAVAGVIRRAQDSIENLCWFHVDDPRCEITRGRIDLWRVTVRVGFTL